MNAVQDSVTTPPPVEVAIPVVESKPRLRDQRWFQRLVVWGGLLLAWEIAGVLAGPFFFPRFTAVFGSFLNTFSNGDMALLAGSLRQMFVGFALAAVIGIPIGMLMGSSRIINHVLGIYVNALFVTSLEALLPFLIILFGTQFQFRVAVVFLFALFFIIINTAAGVCSVGRDLIETARAFCTPRRKIFTKIMLPAALPYIIAGLRLGLGHAIKGMVIAELWVTIDTGRRLVDLGLARNLPAFFAIALSIVVIGALSTQALLILQRRVTPWATEITGFGGRRKV